MFRTVYDVPADALPLIEPTEHELDAIESGMSWESIQAHLEQLDAAAAHAAIVPIPKPEVPSLATRVTSAEIDLTHTWRCAA